MDASGNEAFKKVIGKPIPKLGLKFSSISEISKQEHKVEKSLWPLRTCQYYGSVNLLTIIY